MLVLTTPSRHELLPLLIESKQLQAHTAAELTQATHSTLQQAHNTASNDSIPFFQLTGVAAQQALLSGARHVRQQQYLNGNTRQLCVRQFGETAYKQASFVDMHACMLASITMFNSYGVVISVVYITQQSP